MPRGRRPISYEDAMASARIRMARRTSSTPNGRGCLEWAGSRSKLGYGKIGMAYLVDGTRHSGWVGAHVVAWELVNGPIPDGLCVCHQCDNPACVNLSHLFLGTKKQNSEDMVGKDRSCRGDRHGNAKFSREQVAEICRLYATGEYSQSRLAGMYGTRVQNISRYVRGDRFKSAGGPTSKHNLVLTEENVREIHKLISEGLIQKQIAEKFGVATSLISHINTGRIWRRLHPTLGDV